MGYCSFIVFLLTCQLSVVTSTCTPKDLVCVFHLDITEELTMVHGALPVKLNAGKVYKYNEVSFTDKTEIPLDQVITGDGWSEARRVTVFNKQMPGPAIEVYQGQTVNIHVTNSLHSGTTAIHWYGVEQRGTPWMDGVGYITQCPILPGESFTYTFRADRKGTYWYHSTIAGQAMDGAFGPFIVRDRSSTHSREFVMTVQDWNHSWDSEEMDLKREHGWFIGGKIIPASTSPTGSKYNMLRVDSGLVNGRGRYYTNPTTHNSAPLSQFVIQQGLDYRFRTIHAGSMLPFRMSVDDHMLTIVALDGVEVMPVTVESFIISPGERVDFIIYGDKAVNNYWIRGEALEANNPRLLSAVLKYQGAPDKEPTSSRRGCVADDLCLILNCPFADYTSKPNTKCIPVDKLKSAKPNPMQQGSNFREIFLNFAFPGYDDKPGSVNGYAFDRYPHSPPLIQDTVIPCDASQCGNDKVCHCPLVLNLQQGTQLQMVLTNMGEGKGWDHPIHIHGHHVSVLKTGFANYDKTTGLYRSDNLDIDCLGNPNRELNFCNSETWGNPAWLRGNIPDINLHNPPEKDTIVVPSGGYVVVRLRADNPGLWFMHCDSIPHMKEGMALLLNETYSAIPHFPAGFPTCGEYNPVFTIPQVNPSPTIGKLPPIG